MLYTDGFLEAADPRGDFFGVERLKTAVRNHLRHSVDDLADGILQDIREFSRGTPPGDDMTLLVVRYEGRP